MNIEINTLENLTKWAWMLEWCRQKGLNSTCSLNWHKAELAWKSDHSVNDEPEESFATMSGNDAPPSSFSLHIDDGGTPVIHFTEEEMANKPAFNLLSQLGEVLIRRHGEQKARAEEAEANVEELEAIRRALTKERDELETQVTQLKAKENNKKKMVYSGGSNLKTVHGNVVEGVPMWLFISSLLVLGGLWVWAFASLAKM